jgi:hypothetical protein
VSADAVSQTPPRTLWRDDLVCALTGGLLILGLFIDGWNHLNLQNGKAGEFITPWHGLLYAGFNACAIWAITRNTRLRAMMFKGRGAKGGTGAGIARSAPQFNSVHVALAGLGLAAIGIVGDGVARASGVVADQGAMQPPFDFLLFTGAGLVFAIALRSAVSNIDNFGRRVAVPVVLGVGATAALIIAFGGHAASNSVDQVVRTIAAQPSVSQSAPRTFPATHHERQAAASHASRVLHRSAAVSAAHHAQRSASHASSSVAASAAASPTSTSSHHASRTVVVQRRASRHAAVAPRRHVAARPAPQRHVTKHSKGRFQQVAIPDAPSDSSSSTTVTQNSSSGSSGSSSSSPASSPAPAQSPTAAPTPTTSNPPASSPPATPPTTAKHGGPGQG